MFFVQSFNFIEIGKNFAFLNTCVITDKMRTWTLSRHVRVLFSFWSGKQTINSINKNYQ